MSTTPPNVLQLARQGNPDAIAALMNRHLEVQGITAQVVQQESALWVSLEAAQVPNQSELVAYVKKGIVGLELATVNQLTISGKQWGSDADAWREQLTLQAPEPDLAAIDLDGALDGGAIAAPDNSQALADNAMTAEEFDLDLALADSLGEASPEAPTDLDLEFVDSPADFELNFTDDDDLGVAADLDLGLGDGADGADDFDLNFMDGDGDLGDLGTADLDLGSASVSDLDLDLGFDEAGSPPAADLDFDLGLSDGPVAASPTDDLDFDLGLIDEPAPADAVADLDLDFDLLDEPAAMPADDSLEMDFGLSDGPVNADPGADFDLDLELGEGPGAAAPPDFDLDLGEELDLGGLDAAATPAADSDFDLDFGGLDEPAAADALDMDLGLLDEPAPADALDMDLDALDESETFDLGFAAETEAADLGFDVDDLGFGSDVELETTDLGLGEELALGAIADDLETDAAALTPADELDDLWGEGEAAPADLGFTPQADPAVAAADPWGTDLDFPNLENPDAAFEDGLGELGTEAGGDDLADFDAFAEVSEAADADLQALDMADLPGLEAEELDIEPLEAEGFEMPGFDPQSIAPDETDFPDLTLEPEVPAFALDEGADLDADLGVELGADPAFPGDLDAENLDLEALGTADFDLAEPPALADDWANAEADLAEAGLAADPEDLGFTDVSMPPWEEPEGDFDPSFGLEEMPGLEEVPTDSEGGFGDEFNPGLVFDADDDGPLSTPNPFEAGAFDAEPAAGLGYANLSDVAEDDLSFDSTMELDQTVEGDYPALGDLMEEPYAAESDGFEEVQTLEQPDLFAAEPTPAPLGFEGDADDFEAIDLEGEAVGLGGFEAGEPDFGSFEAAEEPGFGDPDFGDENPGDPDFGAAAFTDEGFGDGGFDDGGFDDGGFGDGALDSNGFIQDRNGALIDDEPDATDDFIQEFGADPSTHVSLSPEQFAADGSVRTARGAGLPLRLILGLGLGALVLALAGLLLNGLLGRLRPPTGGEGPVVTEPAPAPDAPPPAVPTDPGAVAEADLFRQAVNAAQNAANQAQTATTSAEWQNVADTWAVAIDLMQRVPESDPNYAVAQQKAVDYQPNQAYAQQNAERLP